MYIIIQLTIIEKNNYNTTLVIDKALTYYIKNVSDLLSSVKLRYIMLHNKFIVTQEGIRINYKRPKGKKDLWVFVRIYKSDKKLVITEISSDKIIKALRLQKK